MENSDIQRRQKFESIGIMTSGVVHEINNLVNIAMNYSDLVVEDRNKPDEIVLHARQISESTQRMADLLQILLNYSRDDDNTASLNKMQDVICRTSAIINKIMTRNQVDFQKTVDDSMPSVNVNRNHIIQILINILLNALNALNKRYPEYSSRKMVMLESSVIEKNGNKYVRTSITDYGEGISEDSIREILSRTDSLEANLKGHGLGLPVSFELARLYNGDIGIESVPGESTTVHLYLPVQS